ncbi:MAG: RES family NAD+ phosphorylase [Deltaproteobacteria bacterium]|nr:RES family NAD+ phosphorylase [Deltaproteobacteria bacterium]
MRAVEAQHLVAMRKLVTSDAAQRVLEELLDAHKPPPPPESARLHYLLFTPFRYRPLRHGSRFGRRHERGIFYGSLSPATCLAEVAYYRLLFLDGTAASLEPLEVDLTLFRSRVRTQRGVDLGADAFRHWRRPLESRTDYRFTQELGSRMREEGVEAFIYRSARDPAADRNAGVLAPGAFGRSRPHGMETWHAFATRAGVEMRRKDFFRLEVLTFGRELFEVDGVLPAPAV